MLEPPFSFDAIMAPLGAERFFAEYEGKQPLHLKGAADKFAAVMTWARLNDLLGQATIWSHNSLKLLLDKEPIPAARYCTTALGRDGGQVLRPDSDKVKDYPAARRDPGRQRHRPSEPRADRVRRTRWSGRSAARCRATSTCRRAAARASPPTSTPTTSMPCTSRAPRPGTSTRAGRVDPIAHPLFKTLSREHHEQAKGAKLMDVHMEPGDLLYLPRGQYHDALADEGGAVHIAFGVTYPIGFDVMTLLFDRVAAEPEFRANLPRPDGPAAGALAGRSSAALGERIQPASWPSPGPRRRSRRCNAASAMPRHAYDLPGLLEQPAEDRFRVRAKGIRLVQQGGRYGLVQEGSRAATEVPADVSADGRVGAGAAGVHARRPGRGLSRSARARRSRSCCATSARCV